MPSDQAVAAGVTSGVGVGEVVVLVADLRPTRSAARARASQADGPARKQPEPGDEAVLLGLDERQLQAEADPEHRPALGAAPPQRDVMTALAEARHGGTRRADARQHREVGLVGVVDHLGAEPAEGDLDRAHVAGSVIADRDPHSRPFVDGSPLPSRLTATRRARPSALKAASAVWWASRPEASTWIDARAACARLESMWPARPGSGSSFSSELGAPAEVDRDACERVVHRHDGVAVAGDPAAVAERCVERRTERERGVLGGVMSTGLEIAAPFEHQIEAGVEGKLLQQVVVEAGAGRDAHTARAVECEPHGKARLGGRAQRRGRGARRRRRPATVRRAPARAPRRARRRLRRRAPRRESRPGRHGRRFPGGAERRRAPRHPRRGRRGSSRATRAARARALAAPRRGARVPRARAPRRADRRARRQRAPPRASRSAPAPGVHSTRRRHRAMPAHSRRGRPRARTAWRRCGARRRLRRAAAARSRRCTRSTPRRRRAAVRPGSGSSSPVGLLGRHANVSTGSSPSTVAPASCAAMRKSG